MPVRPEIQVTGLKELAKAMKTLEDSELPAALKAANKDAAGLVVAEAVHRVPVRSGKLADSIRAMATLRDARAVVGKASTPYTRAIHFGTGARPGQKGPHNIKGTPFMFDALDAVRSEVVALYSAALTKLLKEWQ